MKNTKIFLIVTIILVMALKPTQSYAAKFKGFFYDICQTDDNFTTLHMEFGLDSLLPTDIITISIFKGHYNQNPKDLKEVFTKFNASGTPHQGWFNYFTIRNLVAGNDYTLVTKINGKIVWTEPLPMPGPIPEPKKEPAPTEFKVYPNPSTGEFNIQIPFNEATITISDSEGRIVYSNTQTSYLQKINPYLYLSDGLYFVTLKKGEQKETKKLLINH